MSIGERIARGERAKALLADETLKEVFANAERRAFEEFTIAKSHEDTKSAWQITQALEALRGEFAALVGDGQRAEAERTVEERKTAQDAKKQLRSTR